MVFNALMLNLVIVTIHKKIVYCLQFQEQDNVFGKMKYVEIRNVKKLILN